MNLTQLRQINQQLEKTQQSIENQIHKQSAFSRLIQHIIRSFGRGIELFLSLLGEELYQDADESEQKWVDDCVRSLYLTVAADDPFEAFCSMSAAERLMVLTALGENFAMLYGFSTKPPVIEQFDSPNILGCFEKESNSIYINESFFNDGKISLSQSKLIISTMIHELFHQFQYNASQTDEVTNIPQELTDAWKRNFEHYITYEQDPLAYPLQPLEFYAVNITECFLDRCENKEFVKEVIREIEENEEEDYELA